MFKLTNKDTNTRYNVDEVQAKIKFEIRYERSELDLDIGVFGTFKLEDSEHSAHVSTEWLYLNEGMLPGKLIQELDGLVLFENPYQQAEPSTTIRHKGKESEMLGTHEDSAIYCYVDQPLDMGPGVIALQHLTGTKFRLTVNGDIDFYIVESDIIAEYIGGSIILTNELGDEARKKLLNKFDKTFSSDDHNVCFRESNGHTYLEFSPNF